MSPHEIDFAEVLGRMVEIRASDVHITPNFPPAIRDKGKIQPMDGFPVLTGQQVVLRELRASDATTLFAMLTTEEVSRFISPPPTTVEGFERFIGWTARERSSTAVCFRASRSCGCATGRRRRSTPRPCRASC